MGQLCARPGWLTEKHATGYPCQAHDPFVRFEPEATPCLLCQEAHGYVNLDETGTLKAAADPGLEIFENAVTEGHKLAAGPVQPAAAADNGAF